MCRYPIKTTDNAYLYDRCVECHRSLRKDVMYEWDSCYVCERCVENHTKRGKFEGIHDDEELARALIMYSWAGSGEEDDYMTADGWGYCARFGTYIFMEDERGFVTIEDYGTIEKAGKRFMELYADGMGYQEDDYVLGEDGGVWISGKKLNVWSNKFGEITERRKLAAIRLEMAKTGYYPNVWRENHYSVTLIKDLKW